MRIQLAHKELFFTDGKSLLYKRNKTQLLTVVSQTSPNQTRDLFALSVSYIPQTR